MIKPGNRTVLFIVAFALVLTGIFAGTAFGAGYAIIEQSVTGLGNAFAGGAASAEDSTTIFFNPAGLTRLTRPEFIAAGHIVIPSAEFKNNGSTHLISPSLTGGNGGDGGVTKVVPNLYFAYPINDRLAAGLGVNAPFGLATDYDQGWVGRYHAIKSELTTINISPSIALKVIKGLSFGLGINIQYIDAELTNAIDYGTINALPVAAGGLGGAFTALAPTPQGSDGNGLVKGDDWSVGFTLGLLYEFSENTRLGVNYRSRIDHRLEGDATFSGPLANLDPLLLPVFQNTGVEASVALPDSVSGSIYHRFNKSWAVMADITWTNWSLFKELRIEFDNPAQDPSVVSTQWDDSFRYSGGVTYNPTKEWAVRGGIAFDETPIPDPQHRTPRIPGEDRLWVAAGTGYRFSENLSLDFAYTHIFVDDPKVAKSVTNPEDAVRGGLTGSWDASVDIVSGQVTYRF